MDCCGAGRFCCRLRVSEDDTLRIQCRHRPPCRGSPSRSGRGHQLRHQPPADHLALGQRRSRGFGGFPQWGGAGVQNDWKAISPARSSKRRPGPFASAFVAELGASTGSGRHAVSAHHLGLRGATAALGGRSAGLSSGRGADPGPDFQPPSSGRSRRTKGQGPQTAPERRRRPIRQRSGMRPGPFFLSDVLLPGLDSALSASALCLSF